MTVALVKPDQSQIYAAGKLATLLSASQTDTFAGDGTTVAFTLTKSDVICGSEIVKVNGEIKTEGTDYSVDNTNGFISKITFNTAPASGASIEVEYLYAVKGIGGAREISLKKDIEKEELAVDMSYSKIQIEKGATWSGSFKDFIIYDDLDLMSAFSGTTTTGGTYNRWQDGATKSEDLAIMCFPEQAEVAYLNQSPKKIIFVKGLMLNSIDMNVSGSEKGFDFTAQTAMVVDIL